MIRLTRTGKMFLGVLVLFYLASLTSQSGLLLLLVGIFFGCYVVNLFLAGRSLKQLDLQTPKSVHLSEGQRMTQPWTLINHANRPAGLVTVESSEGPMFRLAALAARGKISVAPDLIYWKRGVYSYSQVHLATIYPFGLVKVSRPMDLPGEVVVYPAVYETQSPRAAGYDVMLGGKHKGNRRSTSGSIFAGIRPIQPEDPLKHIHWKSSSKGQGLMVKTYDEDLSGRVSLIMDCGHSGDTRRLDDCVRAAGSLIFAALDAGHHVEWIDLARLELRLIPPFADGHEILDTLARIEPAPGCLTPDHLHRALERVSVKSAISLVLTDISPAIQEMVGQLRAKGRTVSWYVPERCASDQDLDGAPIFQYSAHSLVERV